jgi:hypothetical protein
MNMCAKCSTNPTHVEGKEIDPHKEIIDELVWAKETM